MILVRMGRVGRGWRRGKIDKWSEDTLYNACRRLRFVDNNDGGEATKEIATAASSSGLLGSTHRALLALVLLYYHLAHDSDTAVLLLVLRYPTKWLLWDPHSVLPGVSRPGANDGTLPRLTS